MMLLVRSEYRQDYSSGGWRDTIAEKVRGRLTNAYVAKLCFESECPQSYYQHAPPQGLHFQIGGAVLPLVSSLDLPTGKWNVPVLDMLTRVPTPVVISAVRAYARCCIARRATGTGQEVSQTTARVQGRVDQRL